MTTQVPPSSEFAQVCDLKLDLKNPRLVGAAPETEDDALEQLVAEADVGELVQAIGNSGWQDFEPLVVLRADGRVLEGNRRLAALRVLRDSSLAAKLGVPVPVPAHPNAVPGQVRVRYVDSVSEARDYIGFKHVNGPHKWDSLAKAKFAAEWLADDANASITDIARRLGDGHNTVVRLVNGYAVLAQALHLGFDLEKRTKATFAFSHLYTALARPTVRRYLGLGETPNEALPPNPVDNEHVTDLLNLMSLLYGQGDKQPTVIGSQNPDLNRLIDVLESSAATAMLLADRDLSVAFAVVEDPHRRFAELLYALNKSARAAAESLGDYDHDPDLHELALGVQKTVRAIVASMDAAKADAESGGLPQ